MQSQVIQKERNMNVFRVDYYALSVYFLFFFKLFRVHTILLVLEQDQLIINIGFYH